MTVLDYVIVAIVAALFVTAFLVYRKKPHCSCGTCNGNCSECCCNCKKAKKQISH